MPIVPLQLNNKSSPSRYKQGGDARLINCYVEQIGDQEGKVPWAIYASDGLQNFCNLPDADGGVRATLYVDNKLYVVAGTKFYSVTLSSQTATLIGGMLISKTAPVFMERNRRSLNKVSNPDIMIVCDGVGYYYRGDATPWTANTAYPVGSFVSNNGNFYVAVIAGTSAPTGGPSGTGTQIVDGQTVNGQIVNAVRWNYVPKFGQVTTQDADLLSPQSLTFNNGYFIISTLDNTYQSGKLDDVLNWEAGAFGRADANPDNIVRVAQYMGDVVLFGEKSTQFVRDTGDYPFPYSNIQSNDIGIFGSNSVANIEQTLAYVANDRSVRILNGYNSQKISSHAVDRDIQKITDPNEIIATSWISAGHTFYCVSSKSWTWVYDTVTGAWHERKTHNSSSWNIANVVRADDILIAGDKNVGKLYRMSSDYTADAEDPIVSSVILPPVHAFPYPLTLNALYMDIQAGVGTGHGTSEDVDPSIILEWSIDGGENYKGKRLLKLGKQGQNLTRVRTWRLGQSKEDGFTLKVSWSADVARALYGVTVDMEKDAA